MADSKKYMVIGAAVAVLALVVLVKKKGAAAAVGAAVGGAAVDVVSGAVGGVSMGIGDLFGLPRTEMTECEKLIAEGRLWEASYTCPAGTFIGAAVPVAADVFAEGVMTVGEKIGVPRTNMTECERAKAEGRTLDASFACSAGDFLDYINPFK